ncbi:UNKNOWN [Stylonychia lemnae]|uniref:Uncharacterized protein n=1 Tax=Stylonychia lemnae TaxID=5949 RepID=A0A077ZUT1_STYLE|nr:UNKNOWN [Stylonychia lemnae]|eukprot:CDW73659.1 UNKNOWN [Stylonychia lemnae]
MRSSTLIKISIATLLVTIPTLTLAQSCEDDCIKYYGMGREQCEYLCGSQLMSLSLAQVNLTEQERDFVIQYRNQSRQIRDQVEERTYELLETVYEELDTQSEILNNKRQKLQRQTEQKVNQTVEKINREIPYLQKFVVATVENTTDQVVAQLPQVEQQVVAEVDQVVKTVQEKLPQVQDQFEAKLDQVVDQVVAQLPQAEAQAVKEFNQAIAQVKKELPKIQKKLLKAINETSTKNQKKADKYKVKAERLIEQLEELTDDVFRQVDLEENKIAEQLGLEVIVRPVEVEEDREDEWAQQVLVDSGLIEESVSEDMTLMITLILSTVAAIGMIAYLIVKRIKNQVEKAQLYRQDDIAQDRNEKLVDIEQYLQKVMTY